MNVAQKKGKGGRPTGLICHVTGEAAHLVAGYVRVGHAYQHRLVMEHEIGRPLEAGEEVHHLNGIKHDNRPENLLLTTHAEHPKLHARLSDEEIKQLILAGVPGPKIIREHHVDGVRVRRIRTESGIPKGQHHGKWKRNRASQ